MEKEDKHIIEHDLKIWQEDIEKKFANLFKPSGKGDNEFEMTVDSMQINHEPVERGKSGEEVAVKVTNPTKEGALVYKVA